MSSLASGYRHTWSTCFRRDWAGLQKGRKVMKGLTHSRGRADAGVRVVMLFVFAALAMAACVLPFLKTRAATPASGTISATSSPLSWDGTATGTGAVNGESSCIDGINCDTFTLTVG